MTYFDWTNERIANLKRLHAEGKSATEIAAIIGSISRNAVIGKLHRLNLSAVDGPKPVGNRFVAKPERSVKPLVRTARRPVKKADPVKAAEIKKIEARPVSKDMPKPLFKKLFDLGNRDCKWPVKGEKASTLFCGHPVETGCSYCPGHKRMSIGAGTASERNVYQKVA